MGVGVGEREGGGWCFNWTRTSNLLILRKTRSLLNHIVYETGCLPSSETEVLRCMLSVHSTCYNGNNNNSSNNNNNNNNNSNIMLLLLVLQVILAIVMIITVPPPSPPPPPPPLLLLLPLPLPLLPQLVLLLLLRFLQHLKTSHFFLLPPLFQC